MPIAPEEARTLLLQNMNQEQEQAISSTDARLLVVAGAGSGKTEVMARRVAWWLAVEGVPRDEIIAFTFTDAAAEELKFRIRAWLQRVALPEEDPTLGGMFIGTIHGFCLSVLREIAPDDYYVYDVLDEAGRISLLTQGYHNVLALPAFQAAATAASAATGQFDSVRLFLRGYDLLNEYGRIDIQLPPGDPPYNVADERDWCQQAVLLTPVGNSPMAEAFAVSAARYYAYLKARRFLDFSTAQAELERKLRTDAAFLERVRNRWSRLVVDEVQDINHVQFSIINQVIGDNGHLTAVGDHRQAIYSFRGGRIDLMGELFDGLTQDPDGRIIELPRNYRSTPRIIDLSNRWSDTIRDRAGMSNPHMAHGRDTRNDVSDHHVAAIKFGNRQDEAHWIANTISQLVRPNENPPLGAFQDERDGERGLTYSDVAVLVRSSTDIRTYQDALRAAGVPAVVRGGPDLFSQAEVLMFLAAFARCGDVEQFMGQRHNTLPERVQRTLGTTPETNTVVRAAAQQLRQRGLGVALDAEDRVLRLVEAIRERITSDGAVQQDLRGLQCQQAVAWLTRYRNRPPRRVFPQTVFHWLLSEAGIQDWENENNREETESVRFHIGQLSALIKGLETSGWTTPSSLKWQIIALLSWGASSARTAEAPLLVSPNAVSITTIHAAKGLEYPAVFLADICARRFPSNMARRVDPMPFDAVAQPDVNTALLADNANNDNERRLMYVALTRAERYLFASASGNQNSAFFRELQGHIDAVGGFRSAGGFDLGPTLRYETSAYSREDRLATSFSDLRYYLECPYDFYMRKVLGFTPTIGQEFGYGRGLHNLLREVHSDPVRWAALANDPAQLEGAIRALIDRGMFYLRYTTGDPMTNLQDKAVRGVAEYVEQFAEELSELEFEPEREFETLLDNGSMLVSGAIDVIRLDDPPRVTIIDFKSGDAEDDTGSGLTSDLMAMQIGVYGLAARHELEYDPRNGLVRYIGEPDPDKRQLAVDLTDEDLARVRAQLERTGQNIRQRTFNSGPTGLIENRCQHCDFLLFCGRDEARRCRGN